ncbi:MAG: hypothetical protein M0Z51_14075 [Propionibacterium sp.]|nr:hypothetical protein [Propionibacterium sp.]
MTGWLFALAGVLTGFVHATALAYPGRRVSAGTWPLRVLGVGAVLLVAALAGQLLAAVAGWVVGFLAAGVLAWRRMP